MAKKFFDADDRAWDNGEDNQRRRPKEFKNERRERAAEKRSYFESFMSAELEDMAASFAH